MVPTLRRLRVTSLLLALTIAALLAGPVPAVDAGDHVEYQTRLYAGSAPVIFAAGELVPTNGTVSMLTIDFAAPQVGGLFCQSPAGGLPCLPSDRTAVSFCIGITLRDGINWDSTMDTYVYVGSPNDRLSHGASCVVPTPATAGEVKWY